MMERWNSGMMGRKWMTIINIPIFQYSSIPTIYIMFNKKNMTTIKEGGFLRLIKKTLIFPLNLIFSDKNP
jgi:hypothetical protein